MVKAPHKKTGKKNQHSLRTDKKNWIDVQNRSKECLFFFTRLIVWFNTSVGFLRDSHLSPVFSSNTFTSKRDSVSFSGLSRSRSGSKERAV